MNINWWHSIDLGNGVVTPGRTNTKHESQKLGWPDVKGKTVLDVGTWDGYYAFEAERRGASRVVAIDSVMWRTDTGRAGFDHAHAALGSRVEALELEVLDITPERVGTFDVVLFLGVLYHMRHPLLALERMASVTRELLIVETYLAEQHLPERPALVFPPPENKGTDAFFGPNEALVHHWLKLAGMSSVTIHKDHRQVVHAQPAVRHEGC